jgi:putative sterol carrier protein|tara:strand:+ start:2324 stop:2713 length:390 start_codon:yes stop_codon:yes gene_type:complete
VTTAAHLSPEWTAALNEAAALHPGFSAGVGDLPVTIGYLITDGPSWYIVIGTDRIRVLPGSVSSPDVSFSTDAATATEIYEGRIDPLRAVVDGALEIGGDPRLLMANRDVLEAMGDLFAAVREGLGDSR